MKTNTTLIVAALVLLGAGIAGGFWLGSRPMSHAQHAAAPAAGAPAGERKPLYWHDPMHPQQKFDKPGKSPFMDMMLVPVYAEDGGGSGSAEDGVRINARTTQNLGVRTAIAGKGAMGRELVAVGAVTFDERAVVTVQSRVAGTIEKLHVRAPLDPVTAGQPLAEILAPDWVAAQQEYLALKSNPRADAPLREAARARLQVLGLPEAAIAELEREGKVRSRVTLHAPVSGVVGELTVREGMTVMPGAMLFRLNGLSSVWINADVAEAQAGWVAQGAGVSVSVPSYPGETFAGRVIALLPEVNAATRTLKVRIGVDNARRRLVPGMFAQLAFKSAASAPVLRVPSEALIQTGTRSVVLLAEKDEAGTQRFKPVEVETGMERDGFTEIKRGLAEGASVVLSGQFLIDSESSLKAAVARMAPAPTPAPSETHKGSGKVESIDAGSVTIAHGPIESRKMGAMTMEFKAPKAGVPAGVKEGDRVEFEFTLTAQGDMALTRIEPITGKPAAKAAATAAAGKPGARP